MDEEPRAVGLQQKLVEVLADIGLVAIAFDGPALGPVVLVVGRVARRAPGVGEGQKRGAISSGKAVRCSDNVGSEDVVAGWAICSSRRDAPSGRGSYGIFEGGWIPCLRCSRSGRKVDGIAGPWPCSPCYN